MPHTRAVPSLPNRHCPKCGSKIDDTTAFEGEDSLPVPGDIMICVYCASVLEVDESLRLQILSTQRMLKIALEEPGMAHKIKIAQDIVKESL